MIRVKENKKSLNKKDIKSRIEKIIEKNIKKEKNIDQYIINKIYSYQEEHDETYEVQNYEIHKAKKLEKFRLEKIGMQRKGIE